MLRPRVDFPYVPNKTRPYFVIKTRYDNDPKAAFIPFRLVYIPSQKRPLSHDLTVSFHSAYNTEPKAAGSGFRVSRSLCKCAL